MSYFLHNYAKFIISETLVIIDQNEADDPSVTNSMSIILPFEKAMGTLDHVSFIIYRDSTGVFDGVEYQPDFYRFYSLNFTDMRDAINQARSKPKNEKKVEYWLPAKRSDKDLVQIVTSTEMFTSAAPSHKTPLL